MQALPVLGIALFVLGCGIAAAQGGHAGGGGRGRGGGHSGGHSAGGSSHSGGAGHDAGASSHESEDGHASGHSGSASGSHGDGHAGMGGRSTAASGRGMGKGRDPLTRHQVVRGGRSVNHGSGRDVGAHPSDFRGPSGTSGRSAAVASGRSTGKGELYRDLWVILRDANGISVLDARGHRQPLDANGNLVPLDAEGAPLDESRVVEVELARMNMARAPAQVLDRALLEAIRTLNAASAVGRDPAGRIVVTVAGVQKTIDSPRENLALYRALMTSGALPGLALPDGMLGELASLKVPGLAGRDMAVAASFLAAASDKYVPITVDAVIYLNTILGVGGTLNGSDGRKYIDYSRFAYSRSDAFPGVVTYLAPRPDGAYATTTGSVVDSVFAGATYESPDGGVDGFAMLADDARRVIAFLHDSAVPE